MVKAFVFLTENLICWITYQHGILINRCLLIFQKRMLSCLLVFQKRMLSCLLIFQKKNAKLSSDISKKNVKLSSDISKKNVSGSWFCQRQVSLMLLTNARVYSVLYCYFVTRYLTCNQVLRLGYGNISKVSCWFIKARRIYLTCKVNYQTNFRKYLSLFSQGLHKRFNINTKNI